MERTLFLVKPDAVERGLVARILARPEEKGLRIVALRMLRLSPDQARGFYAVHEGKPFLDGLVEYMSSGPICAAVLEGDDAIQRLRDLVGSTDPKEAAPGTIRAEYGLDVRHNAVHASDSPASARTEIAFFARWLSLEPE